MTNEIGKIIKTTDTLHWGRYEPSQDKRHKNIPKKKKHKFNSQSSGPFLPLLAKEVKFPNRPH